MERDQPRIGIGVVVLRGEEVLLIRRGKEPNKGEWSIPGGHQKLGETVREAAVREVREETGLDVALGGLLDVFDSIYHEDGVLVGHYTLIDFWAVGDGVPVAGDDAAEAEWVSLDEAVARIRWHATREALETAVALRDKASGMDPS